MEQHDNFNQFLSIKFRIITWDSKTVVTQQQMWHSVTLCDITILFFCGPNGSQVKWLQRKQEQKQRWTKNSFAAIKRIPLLTTSKYQKEKKKGRETHLESEW